jgi:RNA polymerase primary sigma factor
VDQPTSHADCQLADILPDHSAASLFETVAFDALRRRLHRAMRALTARERVVLRLRYGLEDGQSRSLAEVGEVFSVSRERIRQIEQHALAKIRHGSQAGPLASFVE